MFLCLVVPFKDLSSTFHLPTGLRLAGLVRTQALILVQDLAEVVLSYAAGTPHQQDGRPAWDVDQLELAVGRPFLSVLPALHSLVHSLR